MRRPLSALLIALSLLVVGCGDDAQPVTDAGTFDAHVEPDAGPGDDDAGAEDAGSDAGFDAGELDAGVDAGEPDAGGESFVMVTGTCGVLDDDELLGASPYYVENHLDFPGGFDEATDLELLSDGAREIFSEGTAGGSSLLSEVFAFEVLRFCEAAELVKSETEIVYEPPTSKKTDLLVEIDGYRIGVSVTRAVTYPRDMPYTLTAARTLLERKLSDILESSANVVEEDSWHKQILVVIAYSEQHARVVMEAWGDIDAAIRADTILWVTISDGDDEFLY